MSTKCIEEIRTFQDENSRDIYYRRHGYGRYEKPYTEKIYTCHNISLPFAKSGDTLQISECNGNCSYILKIESIRNQTLPPLAFVGSNDFDVIYMENLQIEHLSSGTFSSLDRVSKLYLSKNNITEITEGVLNSLHQLEILDVSLNKIQHIAQHFLTGTKFLRVLNLSSNCLTNFDISFVYSVRPISIDLSINFITTFSFNNTISNINILNVSHNQISSFDGCLSNYEHINLRYNKLKSFPQLQCSDVNFRLKYLDLGQNFLFELQNDFNVSESSLEYLFLDHNDITTIPQRFSEQFPSLISLNLSFNHLTKLQYGAFEHFSNLMYLNMSHNRLTNIGRYIHALNKLVYLDLNDNNLNSLDAQQIVRDLPQLTFISVDKNYFICEDLVDILHGFQLKNINVSYGETKETSNVRGIACLETNKDSDVKKKVEELLFAKMKTMLGNGSTMNDYMNKDFKNSSFYKYLQSLQTQNSFKFNESELVSYFNKDFKNSSFYRYLESLRGEKSLPSNLNQSFYNYFNNDFRNSGFVKYLEDLKRTDYILNDGFSKSKMFDFFNETFANSQFYKYFENIMKQNNLFGTTNNSQIFQKSSSYFGDIYVLEALLFLIAFVLCFLVLYLTKLHFFSPRNIGHENENVALCET